MNTNKSHTGLGLFITLITPFMIMTAQEKNLPFPVSEGGMPMNEVVVNRHSDREFDPAREIDDATLGQLLWITAGINRPDAQPSKFGAPVNRSNPTARNWQEIRVFVFGKDGVWEYMPSSHSLKLVVEGDQRALVAGTKEFSQDFVIEAPYSVVFVADMTEMPEGEHAKAMALVDAGIACENLNLACAANGVATVPRATMDSAGISKLLGLTPLQIPVMNNPIGYIRSSYK
ncbi:MAG: nitroreductase family protein [Muribaculaceae bacterium]|nr:nitroreductase family protein [Muribaculaceae bacterium]